MPTLLRNFAGLLFLLIFGLFSCTSEDEELPNILWIVTEDNSKHYLDLYEEDGAKMPTIEALAQNGVVFNNAFSNAPVCSVARSTIISGCYAPRIGAQYHRKMELAPMPEELEMFPTYLRNAGYYTSNNAKEDYNLVKTENTWNESSRTASYKNRMGDQPFFHVQNFGSTHEGRLHFSEEQMKGIDSSDDKTLFTCYPDTELFRYTNAYYKELHTKVDSQIMVFLDDFEKEGHMENTIIFYYGDHGGVLPGSKGYIYERGVHVPMVVSFPDKWKHLIPFEKGSRTDAFVEFVDLAPTVMNLAGLDIPEAIDGSQFLGKNVHEADLLKENVAFSYADRFDEKYDLVRALRKGKYKYIRNYQPFNIDGLYNFYRYKMLAYQEWEELFDEGALDDIASQFFLAKPIEGLYDLSIDPHETNNLAGSKAHREVLLSLRAQLQNQVKSMPDLSFYPESYFIEKGIQNPVNFGQENKTNIEELVEVADLQLRDFNDIQSKLDDVFRSEDPWKRYWGLIVCSSFADEASVFFGKARDILENDEVALNQIRAWEFLSLGGEKLDNHLVLKILENSKSETECNLILNSVALIKSINKNFDLQIPKSMFDPKWVDQDNDLVNRRLDYVNGHGTTDN